MAKNPRIIDVPQTKGTFEVVGVVTRTQSDKFYKDILTKKSKPMRMINFGIEFNKGKEMFISFSEQQQEVVYFTGKEHKDDPSYTTFTVPWNERTTFKKEGFSVIGVKCGITKDEDGKNIQKTLTKFDASKYLDDYLEDGMSVFIKGNIEYQTYEGKVKSSYVPTQISLCSKEIDFDAEGFVEKCNVKQAMVVTGLEMLPKEEKRTLTFEGKEYEMGRLTAQIVSYKSIETITAYLANISGFCKTINGLLKKHESFALEFFGTVHVSKSTEEVDIEDGWGGVTESQKVNQKTITELYLNAGVKESLNIVDYTVEKMDEAVALISASTQAKNDYDKKTLANGNKFDIPVELATAEDFDDGGWD